LKPPKNPPVKPVELSPELLLRAYAAGIFPMSESRDDADIFWVDPETRGVLPLDDYHIPKSLKKIVRRNDFDVHCNKAFGDVLRLCATVPGRPETWINPSIQRAVTGLHEMGFAHSVECWQQDQLVGGLYGIALGGAFFGESMFSLKPNASKVALVHLVARLKHGRFNLLDTQFVTEHLTQFGVIEIPARIYLEQLSEALSYRVQFPTGVMDEALQQTLSSLLSTPGGPKSTR